MPRRRAPSSPFCRRTASPIASLPGRRCRTRPRGDSVMQIEAILRRWINTLATLYLAWRERSRERESITVAFAQQQLVIRDASAADFKVGQILSARAARAARNSFVILEF